MTWLIHIKLTNKFAVKSKFNCIPLKAVLCMIKHFDRGVLCFFNNMQVNKARALCRKLCSGFFSH